MRNPVIGLMLMLALLLAACGPFAPAEQPAPTSAPVVSTPTTVPAVSAPTPSAPTTAPQTTATARPTTAATPAGASGDVVRIMLVACSNEARYRVREQLVCVNFPSDAIGATKSVSGVIVAKPDGAILKDQSKITVALNTLKSDEDRRDNFLRMSVLQTNRYPNATFVPTEAKGLTLPIKDGPLSFQLIGDLTIRDVTKPVTWEVKGEVKGGEARGQATTSFTFAYFNMTKPQVPVVLSVEDNIKLELDLHLKRE